MRGRGQGRKWTARAEMFFHTQIAAPNYFYQQILSALRISRLKLAAEIVSMQNPEEIIGQTNKWIKDVVIGCNFCPFAAREIKRSTVHYRVVSSSDRKICVQAFMEECKRLDTAPAIETTLVIFPAGFQKFESYLDLLGFAEKALKKSGYEGVYQVASFHPSYQFGGAPLHDPANYTNRSPYPMLQLLREEGVEKALAHYPDPEGIPERNIAFARQKGLAHMQALLKACL
jgi:hypothetical protein